MVQLSAPAALCTGVERIDEMPHIYHSIPGVLGIDLDDDSNG
jgi:hypothetical protein